MYNSVGIEDFSATYTDILDPTANIYSDVQGSQSSVSKQLLEMIVNEISREVNVKDSKHLHAASSVPLSVKQDLIDTSNRLRCAKEEKILILKEAEFLSSYLREQLCSVHDAIQSGIHGSGTMSLLIQKAIGLEQNYITLSFLFSGEVDFVPLTTKYSCSSEPVNSDIDEYNDLYWFHDSSDEEEF